MRYRTPIVLGAILALAALAHPLNAQSVRVDATVRTGDATLGVSYGSGSWYPDAVWYEAGCVRCDVRYHDVRYYEPRFHDRGRRGPPAFVLQRKYERERLKDLREHQRERLKDLREFEREYRKDQREAEREWMKRQREIEREFRQGGRGRGGW